MLTLFNNNINNRKRIQMSEKHRRSTITSNAIFKWVSFTGTSFRNKGLRKKCDLKNKVSE